MAIPEELIAITTRHQVHIERLKSGDAQKVRVLLVEVDRAIRKKLGARAEFTDYNRGKLERLLKSVTGMLAGIFEQYRGDLLASLREFGEYEAGFETKALNSVVQGVTFATPAPAQVWAAATTAPLSVRGPQGGKLLEPFIRDWSQGEIQAVTGVIRRGVFEGQTNAEIIRAIRGTKALKYRDGLLETTRRHADAVVRTAVQHVSSSARFETWQHNKLARYRWVSTLDSRTTTQCRSLDGQVFELGKGPRPPIHIGCRSTTVPELDDGLDFLDEGATRASKTGPVSADLSYYDWLKQQPAAFQDSALGPIRGRLFRNGGLSAERFARLNLDKNFKPLTLDEMRALEPAAFSRAGL